VEGKYCLKISENQFWPEAAVLTAASGFKFSTPENIFPRVLKA
jgi:hypothetical protein